MFTQKEIVLRHEKLISLMTNDRIAISNRMFLTVKWFPFHKMVHTEHLTTRFLRGFSHTVGLGFGSDAVSEAVSSSGRDPSPASDSYRKNTFIKI